MASFPVLVAAILAAGLPPSLTSSSFAREPSAPVLRLLPEDSYPDALCLDGTQGAYYIRRASLKPSRGWIIALMGGGECMNPVQCALRKATGDGFLAGSSNYPAVDTKGLTEGYLITGDAKKNPDFAEWNHVRIMYCSSDLWTGAMTRQTPKRWDSFHFSGFNILNAALDDLLANDDLGHAETLIVTGESAGGIGVVANLDHVADRLPHVHVVGVPIAGFYFTVPEGSFYRGPDAHLVPNPFTSSNLASLMDIWAMRLPERCISLHASQPWMCLLAEYSFNTTRTPMFVITSLLDRVSMALHAGATDCLRNSEEMKYCMQWGRNNTKELHMVFERASASRSAAGMFTPACYKHTEFEGVTIESTDYRQAVGNWLLRPHTQSIFRDALAHGDAMVFNPSCKPKVELLV